MLITSIPEKICPVCLLNTETSLLLNYKVETNYGYSAAVHKIFNDLKILGVQAVWFWVCISVRIGRSDHSKKLSEWMGLPVAYVGEVGPTNF